MPKFESAPNINEPELNPAEIQGDVNTGQRLEGALTSEGLEKLEVEEGPEEQLKILEGEMETRQQEIARLTESIEGTKAKLNEVRKKLGLPPTEEEPPSIFSAKDKLEKLKAEQDALEEQREKLVSQQERERLIHEEKKKILQEKLNEVFREFEGLNPSDFESIFKSGKTSEGRNFESKSMGSLDPEVAQSLAKAFKEGIKLLPKILEALPELLKKFDEDLTKEATKRVDKKLEEKAKMEEEEKKQKKEEEPEEPKPKEPKVPEGEIPPAEAKPEVNPIEGENVETSKA